MRNELTEQQYREQQLYLWFIYTTGWSSPIDSDGATVTDQIQITADYPFQAHSFSLHVRQANLIVYDWAGLVSIEITQQGRLLSNEAIPGDALQLNGSVPYELRPFRLINANSTVLITYTHAGTTATKFCFCMHGNKMLSSQVGYHGA